MIKRWLGQGARRVSRYEITVAASPDRVYEALATAPLREMPVTRLLFSIRGVPYERDMTLREFAETPPFMILEEVAPNEIVFGVARPAQTLESFRAFAEDGAMKAVANFRVKATNVGSRLSTETWVETFSTRARWLFAGYWLVIGPFSGLIRREWLRTTRRRAERRGGG